MTCEPRNLVNLSLSSRISLYASILFAVAPALAQLGMAGWHSVHAVQPEPITLLASQGTVLLMGTNSGLKRSLDSGTTWQDAQTGMSENPTPVTYLTRIRQGLIATQSLRHYRSTDAGLSWAPFGTQLKSVDYFWDHGDSLFAFAPLAPDSSGDPPRFLSLDNGLTWKRAGTWSGFPPPRDPVRIGGDTLFSVSDSLGLVRSTDNGLHWFAVQDTANEDPAYPAAMAPLGSRLYWITWRTGLARYYSPSEGVKRFIPFTNDGFKVYEFVGEGDDLCISSGVGVSCSWDNGEHWNFLRDGSFPLAMGNGYLYLNPDKDIYTYTSYIWRFDMRAKVWAKLSWTGNRPLQILMAASGSKLLLYCPYGVGFTALLSDDNGDTLIPFPRQNRPLLGGPTKVFLSQIGWGISYQKILATLDDGLNWIELPANVDLTYNSDKSLLGSRLYAAGNLGIWTLDLGKKDWSMLPGCVGVAAKRLSVTDSTLFAIVGGAPFRFDMSASTALASRRPKIAAQAHPRLWIPSLGPQAIRVSPLPGVARPGIFDLNGIESDR
jgi:hypothetical protein